MGSKSESLVQFNMKVSSGSEKNRKRYVEDGTLQVDVRFFVWANMKYFVCFI